MFCFLIKDGDQLLGVYEAHSQAVALDHMAKDQGFANFKLALKANFDHGRMLTVKRCKPLPEVDNTVFLNAIRELLGLSSRAFAKAERERKAADTDAELETS